MTRSSAALRARRRGSGWGCTPSAGTLQLIVTALIALCTVSTAVATVPINPTEHPTRSPAPTEGHPASHGSAASAAPHGPPAVRRRRAADVGRVAPVVELGTDDEAAAEADNASGVDNEAEEVQHP
jgi:hypothetical protein